MAEQNLCAAGVSLRQLLPDADFLGNEEVRATAVCHEARHCRQGDLFVALETADVDAHEAARLAIEQGASAVLAERLIPASVPVIVVEDARAAHGRVCHALTGHPSRRLKTIGVTGTNGKTVTSLLIASVLAAARRRVGVMGSLGYCDAVQTSLSGPTTPTAPELARWLANMEANGCSDGVLELSSEALARRQTSGTEFDAAVITNIRRDHLEFHGNLKNYRTAKARLLEQLKPGGFAVANADCPGSKFLFAKMQHPVMTFGLHSPAELTAQVVERHKSEQMFFLSAGNDTAAVRTRMIGDHHVYNCLAAAAVGLVLGIDLPTIVRGLEAIDSLPGRLERIECGQPFGVYVDVASTPDTLSAALSAVKAVTHGKLYCVFGMTGAQERQQRPLLGRVLERHADRPVLTGSGEGRQSSLEIAHELIDGFQRPARAHILPDRTRAIRWALADAQPGDSVLIAGSDSLLPLGEPEDAGDAELAQQYLYDDEPRILPFPSPA